MGHIVCEFCRIFEYFFFNFVVVHDADQYILIEQNNQTNNTLLATHSALLLATTFKASKFTKWFYFLDKKPPFGDYVSKVGWLKIVRQLILSEENG